MIWRTSKQPLTLDGTPKLMAILNVTPDSFSDGGRFFEPEAAIARGLALEAEGADLLDIGGESTRPGAEVIPIREELRRVIPVIEGLQGRLRIPISIDTRNAEVAEAALAAGACIVNDVQASRADDAMGRLVAASGAGYVCMHMQGTPQTMQQQPAYADVVWEVLNFFGRSFERLTALGVHPEQIAFDPGIGFGKSLEHNLQLLRHWARFTTLGRPLIGGVSRKSFLGKLSQEGGPDRLPGSLAAAVWLMEQGADLLRVHDVSATRQAVRVISGIRQSSE